MTNLDSIWKSRDFILLTNVCKVKAMVFPVVMDRCERWAIKKAKCQKNWCFQIVVRKKTLESPLDCKEIKPVKPKGNQPWIFIGRTDAEAPILWPPDAKGILNGKDPEAGKDWRQKEKVVAEDEMVGWHHRLNRHESEQTLGDSGGDPRVLQSMRPQRVGQDWATEQQHSGFWGRKKNNLASDLTASISVFKNIKHSVIGKT